MKRITLTGLLLLVSVLAALAQSLTIHISGHLYNLASQAPLANHAVYIQSDSTTPPFLNYAATVYTNGNGFYEDNVTLLNWGNITFHVSTFDCAGVLHSAQGTNGGAIQLVFNFSLCDTSPTPCQAQFNPIVSPNNPMKYYFQGIASSNIPYTYLWDYGDGSIGTGMNTYHVYSADGTYTVCLFISNTATNCYDTVCHTITVTSPPPPPPCTASFSFAPCANAINCFHFEANAPNSATQYHWSFGDGSPIATTANPYHTFTQAGTYQVCLTIFTAGCTDTICQTVTVSPPPPPCTASFTVSQDSINPNLYHFHATTTGTVNSYQWGFGDGTSGNGINANHLYTSSGYYIVCLHVYGPNCQTVFCDTIQVTVTPIPCSANFAFAPCANATYCFHFEANAFNATTQYHWSFGDGSPITTTADPYHTFPQAGTYQVCLSIVTANGCQDTICHTIIVGATPQYAIWGHVYAGSNVLLDHGKARLFKVTNGTNAAQLVGISSIDSLGTYHFNNIPAGTYYVKAKATPNSQFFGQYLPTYYPHNTHWVNATAIIVPPTNNPYNINLKHIVTPFGGPGLIGGSITEGFKLSASGLPVPDVDILLKPLSGDPYIYMESDANGTFNFGNLAFDTYEIYPEVTGLTTIPAVITLDAANPVNNNVNLVITAGQIVANVNEPVTELNSLSIYPNPAREQIGLELSLNAATNVTISIIDLVGRQVLNQQLSLSNGTHQLNYKLSTFGNGSYILQLKTVDGLLNRKFSIAR